MTVWTKNKNKRKQALWLMMVAVVMIFAVACSNGNNSNQSGNTSSPQPDASASGVQSVANNSENKENSAADKLSLTFLHVFGGSQGEAIQTLVDRYNASQDQVEVKAEQVQGFYNGLLERLQTLAVSGQLPELAIGSYANFDYMQKRMPIQPVQSFIDAENYDLTDFSAQMLPLGQDAKGEQIAMPFAVSTPLIYVNKDHFAEAGIDYTDAPQSWEQVRAWAKQLAEAAPERSGIYFQMDFDTWMFQTLLETAGGTFGSIEAQTIGFNDEAGKKVLNYWLDMVNADQSYPRMDGNQAAQAFQNGDLSMIVATTGNLNSLTRDVPFELGIMMLPTWEEGGQARKLPAGGAGLYIFQKDAAVEAAAWDFVKFLSSPEGTSVIAEQMGYMAIRDSARSDLLADYFAANPLAASSYNQTDDIVRWFAWPGEHAARVNQVMLNHLQAAFSGEMTGEQALDEAAAEVKRILGW